MTNDRSASSNIVVEILGRPAAPIDLRGLVTWLVDALNSGAAVFFSAIGRRR